MNTANTTYTTVATTGDNATAHQPIHTSAPLITTPLTKQQMHHLIAEQGTQVSVIVPVPLDLLFHEGAMEIEDSIHNLAFAESIPYAPEHLVVGALNDKTVLIEYTTGLRHWLSSLEEDDDSEME